MESSPKVCILVFDLAKLEQGVNICVSYFDRFHKNPEAPSSREPDFWKREAYEVYPLFFVSAMLLVNVCNYIYIIFPGYQNITHFAKRFMDVDLNNRVDIGGENS